MNDASSCDVGMNADSPQVETGIATSIEGRESLTKANNDIGLVEAEKMQEDSDMVELTQPMATNSEELPQDQNATQDKMKDKTRINNSGEAEIAPTAEAADGPETKSPEMQVAVGGRGKLAKPASDSWGGHGWGTEPTLSGWGSTSTRATKATVVDDAWGDAVVAPEVATTKPTLSGWGSTSARTTKATVVEDAWGDAVVAPDGATTLADAVNKSAKNNHDPTVITPRPEVVPQQTRPLDSGWDTRRSGSNNALGDQPAFTDYRPRKRKRSFTAGGNWSLSMPTDLPTPLGRSSNAGQSSFGHNRRATAPFDHDKSYTKGHQDLDYNESWNESTESSRTRRGGSPPVRTVTKGLTRLEISTRTPAVDSDKLVSDLLPFFREIMELKTNRDNALSRLDSDAAEYRTEKEHLTIRVEKEESVEKIVALRAKFDAYKQRMVQQEQSLKYIVKNLDEALERQFKSLVSAMLRIVTDSTQAGVFDLLRSATGSSSDISEILERTLKAVAPQLVREHIAYQDQKLRDMTRDLEKMSSIIKAKDDTISSLDDRLRRIEMAVEIASKNPAFSQLVPKLSIAQDSTSKVTASSDTDDNGGCVVQ